MDAWHVLFLDNSSDLGLETHIKHAISLVQYQVTDISEADTATLNEVNKTAGGGTEQVTPAFDHTKLTIDVGTPIDDSGADPRTVGKLARLVVDLIYELASRSKNKSSGICFACPQMGLSVHPSWRSAGTIRKRCREDGEQKARGFARTSLQKG
jgi:hypothetical protein